MPTDLTERLAAKLEREGFVQFDAVLIGHKAPVVLPLLLSEPELVAPLPDEVRLSVLTPRERAFLELGKAEWAERVARDAWHDEMHDEVASEGEYRVSVAVQNRIDALEAVRYLHREPSALAEVQALTPEGKDAA